MARGPNFARRAALNDVSRIGRRDLKLWRREKARAGLKNEVKMRCPCNCCKGFTLRLVENVEIHLIRNGRMPELRWWKDSGFAWDDSDEEWAAEYDLAREANPNAEDVDESAGGENVVGDNEQNHEEPEIDVQRMISNIFEDLDSTRDYVQRQEFDDPLEETIQEDSDSDDGDHHASIDLNEAKLREACIPLYPDSRMTKLSFSMMFLNICYQHRVPNVAADELLALLKDRVLPKENVIPRSHYHAKRLVARLGLDYNTIHACVKGCVLFRGDMAELARCPKCNEDRYTGESEKQPRKVLRHFPVIPRLLRMFRMPNLATLLKWSGSNKSTDGLVRHAGDSQAWKHFDELHPDFAAEPRNVRFGLALDGVNPFSDKSTSWSTWPILLINYNLPPWLCTKKFFIQLALLIPGKESVKGHNLDVYLAPLVEELQLLWFGIHAVDKSAEVVNKQFKLRAMLLWTINDYPALGTISGQCTSGYLACVVCGPRVQSDYSKILHKPIFQGHRRYLPADHHFRRQRYSHHFNNCRETGRAPARVSSEEILLWAKKKKEYDESGGRPDVDADPYKIFGVKRRSILFSLPYWADLLIHHPIDFMHTEKNIVANLLRMILGDDDKPKVRRDMQARNIRSNLWLQPHPTRANQWIKPAAPYVLTKDEQKLFRARLRALKVPTGYSGALKKHILGDTIGHMKSHDFHVFIQQILPVCIRGLMAPEVRATIMRLSRLFRRLCVKIWDPSSLVVLQEDVALTLVLCEVHFPPAFFDNMTHLLVHLVEEMGLCGPVHCRWMYPVERYLSVMKRYVRNRARPEGCMAECYIQDQALGFAVEYMAGFEPVTTRIWDENEDEGVSGEVVEGAGRTLVLTPELRDLAHNYVIRNTEVMVPWFRKWEDLRAIDTTVPDFAIWVQSFMRNDCSEETSDPIVKGLAIPPRLKCRSYKSIRSYGNHYRVVSHEDRSKVTFDSGIASVFLDVDQAACRYSYVGILSGIYELNYGLGNDNPILFKGSWVPGRWTGHAPTMKIDDEGFLLANFRRMLPERQEPFVFPNQVEQVFFSPVDLADPNGWRIVLRKEARSRRIVYDSADLTRGENGVFSALEAPPTLPTAMPVSQVLESDVLFTSEDLIADERDFSERERAESDGTSDDEDSC